MNAIRMFTVGALLMAAPGLAVADKPSAHDPSGTWEWKVEIDGETTESRLSVTVNGQTVRGTYSDQRVSRKIHNAKFDGETLTFDIEFEADGTQVKASFNGKASADKLTGTANVSLSGQEVKIPINGERKTQVEDVVGEWKLNIETSGGESFAPIVTVTADKGKLGGSYECQIAGTHELQNAALKDNTLTFKIAGDAKSDGSTFSAAFKGTPRGNHIEGTSEVTINGVTGTAKIQGTRNVPEPSGKKDKEDKKN